MSKLKVGDIVVPKAAEKVGSLVRDAIKKEDKQAEYNRRLEKFTEAALTGLSANVNAWSEVPFDEYGSFAVRIAKSAVSALEKEVKS